MKRLSSYRSFVPLALLALNALAISGCGANDDTLEEEIAAIEAALIPLAPILKCDVDAVGTAACQNAIAAVRDQAADVSRTEPVERGLAWLFHKSTPNDDNSYNPDKNYQGYRRDCSGFVSMCWSLGESPATLQMPPWRNDGAYAVALGSLDDLAPGDAVNRKERVLTSDGRIVGHIMLFAGWAAPDHSQLYFIHHSGGRGKPVTLIQVKREKMGDYIGIRTPRIPAPQAPTPEIPPTDPNPPMPTGNPPGTPVPPSGTPARLQLAGPTRIFDQTVTADAVASINVLNAGLPTNDIRGVVLNLAIDNPDTSGFARVWADAQIEPETANLNFVAGETRANLVIAHVGPSGVVDLRLSAGKARMIMDVVGYLGGSGTMGFVSVPQYRAADTRNSAPIAPNGTLDISLGTSQSVAVLSVAALGATAPGYLAAYRSGKSYDGSFSTLNYAANQVISNQAWVEPNGDKITIFNAGASPVHVIVDVNAAFDKNSTTSFVPFYSPVRAFDTRNGGAMPADWTTTLAFNGANVPDTAIGLAYNFALVNPAVDSFASLYASGDWPGTSTINVLQGQATSAGGVTLMGADHLLRLYNGPGIAHMIMDVPGYFVNP